MQRLLRSLLLTIMCLGLLVAGAPQAHADDTPSSWRISRYDVRVDTDAGGTSRVRVEFDFDFADDEGHGPFVTLPLRQRVEGNPDVWRMIDVDVTGVSSPSGAPADLEEEVDDGDLVLRIGHPRKEVSGVQTYVVEYTARGLVNPNNAQSGMDEINWNAVGTGWQVPLSNVTATVVGPRPAQRVACFTGRGYDLPCEAVSDGLENRYRVAELDEEVGMQVVAGYQAGTFTGAEPRFEKRHHLGTMFPATPASLGGMVGLGGILIGLVLAKARRWRQDEVYLGLTPGVAPAPGQHGALGFADTSKTPVAVQFTPPVGVSPGEGGVLIDEKADNVDVTATILDLAARGHFQIVEEGPKTWRFVKRPTDDPVTEPERHVLATMFLDGDEVTTRDLRDERYHDLLPGARERLMGRAVDALGWFRGNPQHAQTLAAVGGAGLLVLGVIGGLFLGLWGLGLIGLGVVAAGIVLLVNSGHAGRRTADGSAALAQVKGFEQYLRTAEADQIRFEEGVDVFSRYLPWATVFGVADRWATLFAHLAREGRYEPGDWYVGTHLYQGAAFSGAMDTLTHQLSTSMEKAVSSHEAATSGSSGGSGFSGGGGAGGGGGGGW